MCQPQYTLLFLIMKFLKLGFPAVLFVFAPPDHIGMTYFILFQL